MLQNSPDGIRSAPGNSENGSVSPAKRRRSLSRGAASFVSVLGSDSDVMDQQNLSNQFNDSRSAQLRGGLVILMHGCQG